MGTQTHIMNVQRDCQSNSGSLFLKTALSVTAQPVTIEINHQEGGAITTVTDNVPNQSYSMEMIVGAVIVFTLFLKIGMKFEASDQGTTIYHRISSGLQNPGRLIVNIPKPILTVNKQNDLTKDGNDLTGTNEGEESQKVLEEPPKSCAKSLLIAGCICIVIPFIYFIVDFMLKNWDSLNVIESRTD